MMEMMNYSDFINKKTTRSIHTDSIQLTIDRLNPALYPFQKDIVRWALAKGRAAIFADCGLGKTAMQLEWSAKVLRERGGSVLILAPLAVSAQTVAEGIKFGIPVKLCESRADVSPGINITNYEKLDKFRGCTFTGVVLDESSILKSFDGKVRNQIIDFFSSTPFRLASTATPSPNDYMELGNHSEFLGIMSYTEMLAMFFVHDGGQTIYTDYLSDPQFMEQGSVILDGIVELFFQREYNMIVAGAVICLVAGSVDYGHIFPGAVCLGYLFGLGVWIKAAYLLGIVLGFYAFALVNVEYIVVF